MVDNQTDSTGGNNAPLGAVPAGGGNDTPNPSAEPAVVSIPSEDALIRVPGIDKPVKYGEHVRGFQKQFTQASQRAAALEKELAAEREARQRFERERQAAQTQPQAQPDPFAAAKERGYLTADDAVEMVTGLSKQLEQRDKVLAETVKELLRVRAQFGEVYGNYTNQSFDSKVNKWVADAGYDVAAPGMLDIAKEIYLAYEGNDLDQEFPRIFTERMKQIESYFEQRKRQAFEQAKRLPFVPGRGGNASPSKPLQLDPNASARNIADQMWPLFANESGT